MKSISNFQLYFVAAFFFFLSKCNYIVWCSCFFVYACDFGSVISRAKSNLAMKLLRSSAIGPVLWDCVRTHERKKMKNFELRLNKELIFGTKAVWLNWRTPPHKIKIINETHKQNQTDFYFEILSVLFGLLRQLNLKAFSIDTENENGIEKETDGLIWKSRIYFSIRTTNWTQTKRMMIF